MTYEVLDDTPYGGEIHVLTAPAQLDELPGVGWKLLTAYQMEQFRGFPGALLDLAKAADLPYVTEWLQSLAQALHWQLEVCLTEFAEPLVLVRYLVAPNWRPALSFQATRDLPRATPALLRQVYALLGRIAFDNYGYAGGLLCPPNAYPDLGSYNEWRDAEAPDYTGFSGFYETWRGDQLLVDAAGRVGWYVHDDVTKCRLIGTLETVLPELFRALLEQRQFAP